MAFDVERIRQDFPILSRQVHGVPLVYLDSANTSQKPQVVLDAMQDYYRLHNANVARAVHTLGSEATTLFEGARDTVAGFINAPRRDEVIFTKNISESLNLLAYSLSNASTFPGAERFRIGPGDNIVVTEMEHHSNLVPWQLLAQRTGAEFRYIPIDAGRPAGRPRRSTSGSTSTPRWCPSSISPTRWAPSTRSGCWSTGLARWARCRSWTRPSRHRTVRWTCRSSARISSVSPGTSCTARPGSGCSGAATSCSPSCRRSSVVAR